jgi:hypothetical protein
MAAKGNCAARTVVDTKKTWRKFTVSDHLCNADLKKTTQYQREKEG